MQMTCTECGKVGNEDDLCSLGERCPDELDGCDGVMVTWQPVPPASRHKVRVVSEVCDNCGSPLVVVRSREGRFCTSECAEAFELS